MSWVWTFVVGAELYNHKQCQLFEWLAKKQSLCLYVYVYEVRCGNWAPILRCCTAVTWISKFKPHSEMKTTFPNKIAEFWRLNVFRKWNRNFRNHTLFWNENMKFLNENAVFLKKTTFSITEPIFWTQSAPNSLNNHNSASYSSGWQRGKACTSTFMSTKWDVGLSPAVAQKMFEWVWNVLQQVQSDKNTDARYGGKLKQWHRSPTWLGVIMTDPLAVQAQHLSHCITSYR